jgi:hypothetical protein
MLEVSLPRIKTTSHLKPLLYLVSATLVSASMPCYGQLPNTNFGQFVHQPGDNQYTNQTQAERHGSVMPVNAPVTNAAPVAPAPNSAAYVPTPAAPKPDVSLLPIVADEPIKPAGFPPLPDRLDLPTAGTGTWTGNGNGSSQVANGTAGSGSVAPMDGISRDVQGIHQHYVHYAAGAFMPDQAVQQQQNYKPNIGDYYNVNPGAKPVYRAGDVPLPHTGPANVDTPSTQALKHMGAEPQLAADRVTKPEAPTAVTVNQSVTEDLSLPEDDFNQHYPTNINNNTANRTGNGVGSALAYPARMLLYSGAGMAMGAASMAGIYALHR